VVVPALPPDAVPALPLAPPLDVPPLDVPPLEVPPLELEVPPVELEPELSSLEHAAASARLSNDAEIRERVRMSR